VREEERTDSLTLGHDPKKDSVAVVLSNTHLLVPACTRWVTVGAALWVVDTVGHVVADLRPNH